MDPLSLTASLIAVLGAGSSVLSGLNKLSSWRQAPDAMLALNNEISDFQLVVQMVQDLLQDYENFTGAGFTAHAENLRLTLVRAKERLLALDILIQYRLTTPGENGEAELDRIAWAREYKKVKSIQDEIHSIRINLVAAIGVLTSRASLRIEFQVSELRSIGNELRAQGQSIATADQINASQERMNRTISNVALSQERTERQFNELLAAHAASQGTEESSRPELVPIRARPSSFETFTAQWGHQTLSVCKRQRSHCNPGCVCCCHRRSAWKSSTLWQSFFGLLFVGYAGIPISKPCDDIRCQQKSERFLGIRYYFPAWFTARMLELCVRISRPQGLAQSLRVSRIINARHSKLFHIVDKNDVSGLKAVLSSRQFTPYDVFHESGDTALSQAIKIGHYQICRVLLDAGADPYSESTEGRTPYDLAWQFILGETKEPSTLQAWRTMFPDPDLESYEFNVLHEAVLGLTSLDLETAYQKCRLILDEGDLHGRTPLTWAAMRGDFKILEFLVRNGADVDKATVEGRSPLSWTVVSGYHECTRLLLSHGASMHVISDMNWTPLHRLAAAPKDDLKTLRCLLDYNVELDALTTIKNSPLLMAIRFGNPRIASKLISLGADIHLENSEGENSLFRAVLRNYHQILSQLLRRGADHTRENKERGSFLHLTAEFADIETLRLLTEAHLAPRDVQRKRRKDGFTALEVARARQDVNPEWVQAFQDFVQSVDQTKRAKSRPSLTAFPPHTIDDSDDTDDFFVEALEQQL